MPQMLPHKPSSEGPLESLIGEKKAPTLFRDQDIYVGCGADQSVGQPSAINPISAYPFGAEGKSKEPSMVSGQLNVASNPVRE